MLNPAPGITDSVSSIVGQPVPCPDCAGTTHVARGACLRCMLEGAADDIGEPSTDFFDSVLNEADVPDRHWRLGNYEILGQIGRGGMGVIYRARQRHSRRVVALKRALGDSLASHEQLARFRREAEAAASLDHPNILPIYEVGETDEGLPFFTMKYATGGSLREAAPALRADVTLCVRLMAKVARAIEFAHARGVLHRDLQPGNILLDGRGEPMVSDFGLAKILHEESDLTQTLTTLGTPGFIAPEQTEAPSTAAADIYGLGAILFDLLAGRPPFVGPSAISVIRKAADVAAPRLRTLVPAVDRDLETIVARCLERDPHARYASAEAVAGDLERWLAGLPISARPILAPARFLRWSKRNPLLAATAAACLLLGLADVWLIARSTPAPVVADKSITVLPFANLNGNDDTFFVAGVQEDILRNLQKVSGLKVVSHLSTRDFSADKPRDLGEIGRELGVAYVLQGTVRRTESRVSINTTMSETSTGRSLWTAQFERDLHGVFAIQNQITQKVVRQLDVHLSPAEQASLYKPPTDDLVAYELYLRAKEVGQRPGLPGAEQFAKEVSLLEGAIARDPQFVLALCRLARTHLFAYWTSVDHTPERLRAAQDAIERAAAIAPDAGEVHLARGIYFYWGQREYEPALAQFGLALAALPNEADIPFFVGLIQRRQGKWDLSTRRFEEACSKDPRNEFMLFDLVRTNYFALKRYAEAAATTDAVLRWNPGAFDFQLVRAKVDFASRGDVQGWHDVVWGPSLAYADPAKLCTERMRLALARRDYPAAEAALASSDKFSQFDWAGYPSPREFYLGLIARGLGDEAKARQHLTTARDELAAIVAQRPDDAKAYIVLAGILARLGEKEEALRRGEYALGLRPIVRDAVEGPTIMGMLAGICAYLGETEHALDLLETSARMPNVTNFGELQTDDVWDSLRDHPRFVRVVESLRSAARH